MREWRAWQANMARITDIFDGDIARITGINAQRRQLQQQKELGGVGSWMPGVRKRRQAGRGRGFLFKSRDAFVATKLTERIT